MGVLRVPEGIELGGGVETFWLEDSRLTWNGASLVSLIRNNVLLKVL